MRATAEREKTRRAKEALFFFCARDAGVEDPTQRRFARAFDEKRADGWGGCADVWLRKRTCHEGQPTQLKHQELVRGPAGCSKKSFKSRTKIPHYCCAATLPMPAAYFASPHGQSRTKKRLQCRVRLPSASPRNHLIK